MAYYYKINEDPLPVFKGFHLQKVKKFKGSGPKISYDFSNHVLIELLDDSTPESKLWSELGVKNNKNVVHKRIMVDSHRAKCRRAIVVCVNNDEAKQLAKRISQTKIMNRCVCAVVIQDLLSDLCLFEKQIIQFGDSRPQQHLLYVSDLNRCRQPSGLVKFLKEKFSPFGTILSVLVCPDKDGYAYPEGVIKFAYLSEAFAAELALDQYVVGKERLSVTTHHNILLSQCDLRVRLRNAQWCNNAEPNEFSESAFHSYELNDLSTFDEDPVVNSINNLHISSQNISINNDENTLIHENVSVTCPKDTENHVNVQCRKIKSDYLRKSNMNDINCSTHNEKFNTLPLSESNKNIVCRRNDTDVSITENTLNSDRCHNKNIKIKNISASVCNDMAETQFISSANISSNDQSYSENKLNTEISQGCRIPKVSKIASDSSSFISCNYGPDPGAHSSTFTAEKSVYNSFHSGNLSAVSEYYSISSDCKQLSSIHNDSENKGKQARGDSKKRRKHFTPSQKLCLKSQRISSSQNTVQSTCGKSEISSSSSALSVKSTKGNGGICGKNSDLYHVTSKALSSLPEDPGLSKVTNWLGLPASQSIILTCDTEQNFNIEEASKRSVVTTNKHKNRISVHNTPALKPKTSGKNFSDDYSDNSSVENEDPNEKLVISNEDCPVLLIGKFKSPLQAWLKQELTSSTNNSVIKSQDNSKSIVCAAKTKDVIISVGCSHMTCDSCYPHSTDLLLGYS